MTRSPIDLVIVADPDGCAGAIAAFREGTEWHAAFRRLATEGRLRDPDLVLHLYAYEALERMNEHAVSAAREPLAIPFWPAAAFDAASVSVHAGREIEAAMPALREVRCVLPTPGAAERLAASVLGLSRFDGGRYVASLEESARRFSWKVPEERTRRRQTASALIVRDGRILLERRSGSAKSYPGFWDTPGGHLEPAEDPDDALVREMREELGIEAGSRRLAAVVDDDAPAAGAPYRHHIYLLTNWDGDPAPREGQTIEWWDVQAAARRAAPSPLNPIIARVLAICVANGWIP